MRSHRKAVFGLCLYFLVLGCSLISCNQVKIIAENGELLSLPWTWEVLVHEVGSQHCAMRGKSMAEKSQLGYFCIDKAW